MARVLRVQNNEGKGPFAQPRSCSPEELKALLGYGRLIMDSFSLEPELYADGTRPSHYADVLGRHFDEAAVQRDWAFGDSPLGPGDWRAGVVDEQQLAHWFPPRALGFLASHGFRVAVYDVPADALWRGEYQVSFDLGRSTFQGYDDRHTEAQHAPVFGPRTSCICDERDERFLCLSCPDRAGADASIELEVVGR